MADSPQTLVIAGDFADWSLQQLRDVIVRAEAAGIGTVVLPDDIAQAQGGAGWPDALVLIGWLAPVTKSIRLIGRVSALGHQPYNLARRLASLDLITHGRAGWLIASGAQADAFAAFSGAMRLAGVDLADREREFVEICQGLWQSWDADALVLDRKAALFFRPEAMHALDHEGPHFSVRGPLNVMRSPDGAPLLLREADIADAVTIASPDAAFALLGDEP